MLVEFDTIRSSVKEHHEKEQAKELNGILSVPFHNSEDYKTQISIEMNNIVDFTGGTVWYNDALFECVFVYDVDGNMSNNLFISYKDFKRVFEICKSIKILRHEEL